MLVGLQGRHHQTADGKNDRADQIQAHQFRQQLTLLRAEARRNAEVGIHDLLRKNGNEYRQRTRHQKADIRHTREQIPCGGAIFGGEIFGEQWNERHCQRAAGDQRE